jgi:hypothetical protein
MISGEPGGILELPVGFPGTPADASTARVDGPLPPHCPAARQRESMVYLTGMNRIRYFFAETAPGRPYFVLPIYDDGPAFYRSIGTWLGLDARGSSSGT